MREKYIPNEIVSFTIAKLAREVGFIGNIGLGYRDGEYYVERTGVLRGHAFKTKEAIKELKAKGITDVMSFLEPLISAPKQRFLKHWLYKNRGIIIDIQLDKTTSPKWCFEAFKYKDFGDYTKIEPQEWFLYRTEELALEAALELVLTSLLVPKLNEIDNQNN